MRTITVQEITDAVAALCIRANKVLPCSLEQKISACAAQEQSPVGRAVFDDLIANLQAAREEDIPICQDTGMAVVFIELGQDVHITGGTLREAVDAGVAKGYTEGYLRCSVVGDPLERVNTGDNTPAVLHLELVEGEQVKITVCPKGFGSENMSAMKMMTPAASHDDIVQYVTDCIAKAGSNPCPPIVVGVGIGGNFEHCAYLAKKALCRDSAKRNPKPLYAELEQKMLESINKLGIGPQGFGGTVTALCVNIEEAPTHIAGLPVAVNVGCHVTRHAEMVL
ncbi:MAG: fumarate hydratase [Oscillospiraceae bacterium]|nr:fumarate hydratase [Oscillospiraceae bacterium]